jgi:hypothetical protein
VKLLLALSVVIPRIYLKKFKLLFLYYIIYNIKAILTLVTTPNSLRLCKKAVLIFSPECEPSSLMKSRSKLFSFQPPVIQCAVIPRNGKAFDDVQAYIVKEIFPGIFFKKLKK